MGAQFVTKGFSREEGEIHCCEETKRPLFLDTQRRQPATIPDITPPLHYHSLRVEKGRQLKRFREFVAFNDNMVYPEYIVAYKRKAK